MAAFGSAHCRALVLLAIVFANVAGKVMEGSLPLRRTELGTASVPIAIPQASPPSLLHEELSKLQHPPDCAAPSTKFLVFQYDEEDDINGFGAMFQFLAAALSLAHATNRTLVESVPAPTRPGGVAGGQARVEAEAEAEAEEGGHDTWIRAPEDVCGGLKAGCYFEHISSCVYTGDVSALPSLDSALSSQPERVVRISRIAPYAGSGVLKRATAGDFSPRYWRSDWCTSWPVASSSPMPCWRALWFPFLQSFLYRPRDAIRRLVRQAAGGVAEDEQVRFTVAIHVRRGDALTLDWRSHAGVAEYASAASKALTAVRSLSPRGGEDGDGTVQLGGQIGTAIGQGVKARQDAAAGAASAFIATDSTFVRTALAEELTRLHPGLLTRSSLATILQMSGTGADGQATVQEATVHTETVLKQLGGQQQEAGRRSGARQAKSITVGGAAVLVVHAGSTGGRDQLTHSSGEATVMQLKEWCKDRASASGSGRDPCLGPTDAMIAASPSYPLTAGVIADIWALSHGQALVGTCLSQVSRTAYDLQVAAGRARVQAIALDKEACDAFPHDLSLLLPWQSA